MGSADDVNLEFDPHGKIESINAQEKIIAETSRHPFGLVLVYVETIMALLLAFYVLIKFLPGLTDGLGVSENAAASLFGVFSLLMMILTGIFLVIATHIYWINHIMFTNEAVTQIIQIGIFHRRTSELSVADIEDVTAQRRGVFPTFFNYGNLKIETAGEQDNFTFAYCPRPDAYAKVLLDIRNNYRQKHRHSEG